jgi:hypothetical protein
MARLLVSPAAMTTVCVSIFPAGTPIFKENFPKGGAQPTGIG